MCRNEKCFEPYSQTGYGRSDVVNIHHGSLWVKKNLLFLQYFELPGYAYPVLIHQGDGVFTGWRI